MQEKLKLQFISSEEYRRKLAGLIDREAETRELDRERIRNTAIRFASLLPRLVGEEIDRKTMWERIASAIESAVAKTPGTDWELFCEHVLKHILADSDKASADAEFHDLLVTVREWAPADREQLLEYFQTRLLTVLSFARNSWQARVQRRTKKGETE